MKMDIFRLTDMSATEAKEHHLVDPSGIFSL